VRTSANSGPSRSWKSFASSEETCSNCGPCLLAEIIDHSPPQPLAIGNPQRFSRSILDSQNQADPMCVVPYLSSPRRPGRILAGQLGQWQPLNSGINTMVYSTEVPSFASSVLSSLSSPNKSTHSLIFLHTHSQCAPSLFPSSQPWPSQHSLTQPPCSPMGCLRLLVSLPVTTSTQRMCLWRSSSPMLSR
jgi:hypothetical protein